MSAVTLIFPHQLYADHPCLEKDRAVYLMEEVLFFRQYPFHRQKLVLHRASMKKYAHALSRRNLTIHYIDSQQELSDVRKLIGHLARQNITSIHFADVADNWLKARINDSCKKHHINTVEAASPNFLNTLEHVKTFFDTRKTYHQTAFYIEQRKQRHILLEANGQPLGGRWTFDSDNRLKYPKNGKPPAITHPEEDCAVQEAKDYVAHHFPTHHGCSEKFSYPTDHAGATLWLDEFLTTRFEQFGIYEDALVANEH